jgi:hypothetical protein
VYNPAEPWQDSVELESTSGTIVRLEGVRVHTRPVLGEELAARVTVPVKPLRDLTVIVELPVAFGSNGGTMLGFEVMLKSTNVKVALVACDDVPGDPVEAIGTLNVPAFEDEQLRGMLLVALGANWPPVLSGLHESPVGGVIRTEIEPLNEELVTVIVEPAEVPAWTGGGEVAEIVKSPT